MYNETPVLLRRRGFCTNFNVVVGGGGGVFPTHLPIQMAKIKLQSKLGFDKDGMQMVQPLWKTVWHYLLKMNICTTENRFLLTSVLSLVVNTS